MTDRWPVRQTHDRRGGPAVGAAGDGLAPGTPYAAVIQTEPSGGLVKVTIPSLHLTLMFTARIQPGVTGVKGDTCLVIFDTDKLPWVAVGTWSAPSTKTLEEHLATVESEVNALRTAPVWHTPSLENSWKNFGGEYQTAQYTKGALGFVHLR